MILGRRRKPGEDFDPLRGAIDAARRVEAGPERLSPGRREKILATALAGGPAVSGDPAPLFTSRGWLVAAAVLPAMLAALMLFTLHGRGGAVAGPPQVQAFKAGENVVFTIANGNREHFVYRSARPDRFDPATRVRVTDGVYRDSMKSGDLVFYRID